MYYDQGGRGGPLPMPQQQPAYQQQQQPQMGFKDALAARANKIRSSMGGTQPFEYQNYQQQPMGMAYGQQSQGQDFQSQYGQQPQYGFAGGGYGQGGGSAMGYRRRRPLYQRDNNGRTPGMWDYREQPEYSRPPMQLY